LLIACEGIDGSGKTTTAGHLTEALRAEGVDTLHIDRHRPPAPPGYVRDQLHAIADRLWLASPGAPIHELGELHWAYLTGAYFSALCEAVVRPATERGQTVVVDGWFYKFVARVSTNGTRTVDEVLALLDPVPTPDLVFLFDVPPATAATRRESFHDMERGPLGSTAGDFVSYQADVRRVLLDLARAGGWVVVEPADQTPERLARHLADRVLERCRRSGTGGTSHPNA
jgi:dTMP kinase